jgi:hypothetical protein
MQTASLTWVAGAAPDVPEEFSRRLPADDDAAPIASDVAAVMEGAKG